MSHDSGFRRGNHDATHRPKMRMKGHSKGSDQLEERLRRKREQSERIRKLMEAQRSES